MSIKVLDFNIRISLWVVFLLTYLYEYHTELYHTWENCNENVFQPGSFSDSVYQVCLPLLIVQDSGSLLYKRTVKSHVLILCVSCRDEAKVNQWKLVQSRILGGTSYLPILTPDIHIWGSILRLGATKLTPKYVYFGCLNTPCLPGHLLGSIWYVTLRSLSTIMDQTCQCNNVIENTKLRHTWVDELLPPGKPPIKPQLEPNRNRELFPTPQCDHLQQDWGARLRTTGVANVEIVICTVSSWKEKPLHKLITSKIFFKKTTIQTSQWKTLWWS